MKCVKHLSVALAEFLHFMLLTHLQELSHSVDARFIGLWRQCIIDACLQIGFAGFCRQSFGDKYYVYAWKPLVEAGDVKAILFCVGLLVKDGCVIPFADAVYDFGSFTGTGDSNEHAIGNLAQGVDGSLAVSYVDII